jgi:hypothetical protein
MMVLGCILVVILLIAARFLGDAPNKIGWSILMPKHRNITPNCCEKAKTAKAVFEALETDEGRVALAQAMVEPIRRALRKR